MRANSDWISWGFLVGGVTYPAWRFSAPGDASDPLAAWIAIGGVCAARGAVGLARPALRDSAWLAAPAFLLSAHLHILMLLNASRMFYAIAALVQAIVTLLVLPRFEQVLAFAFFTAVASLLLFALSAGEYSLYYGGAMASLLYIVGHHLWRLRTERREAAQSLTEVQAKLEHEQAERIRLQEELVIAQRMDSLGRLAGAFSHEFNNQLMAIRIHAELLENSLPSGAPQRRDLDRIQATTSAAADLTARLLAFSRPTRGSEEPADLAAVVRQSVVTLRHLMTEKTPVAWSVPESACKAPVGAKQLNQILLNLALNARDAMPLGGALSIDVSRKPRGAVELPIDIPCETLVVLTVCDTGTGIAPELRDRIFEPFFTTKGERGNSGLGLSIVYGIVKETGGHIRVTSEPGKGTRFDLFWPEQVAAAAEAPAIAPAIAVAEPHRARVLLVEDQAVLRDGLTRWLGSRGFAVVSCESAEEALARANGVDVIASDVVLRGMDGIELLGRLRRRTPLLPAVLFSGHLDHLAAQRREIPEGVMFLEKPFTPEVLVTTIDGLVEAARAAAH